MNNKAPLAEIPRVVLFGNTNSGKSSLMNALFGRSVAIVSSTPGTTTDPVTRRIELPGAGPAAITDTAGLNDADALGVLRIEKTDERIKTADILVMVLPAGGSLETSEKSTIDTLGSSGKPVLFVFTKTSESRLHESKHELTFQDHVLADSFDGRGITKLTKKLGTLVNSVKPEPPPLSDIVREGEHLLLVTPVDLAAPKGRLIMPQVETIRDGLDRDCSITICKERELRRTYAMLKEAPSLVVTDSQVFHKVAADIPHDQALTSFSILFARKKGNLSQLVEGLSVFDHAKGPIRVMIMEACSHHRMPDDIGTVKIPRLVRQLVHPDCQFVFTREYPKGKGEGIDAVIHCGGCMIKRNSMILRLETASQEGIPVTNYGLFIAWANGLLPRAISMYGDAVDVYESIAGKPVTQCTNQST